MFVKLLFVVLVIIRFGGNIGVSDGSASVFDIALKFETVLRMIEDFIICIHRFLFLSSFDPASVYCFLTVFNPFVMGGLMMWKVAHFKRFFAVYLRSSHSVTLEKWEVVLQTVS